MHAKMHVHECVGFCMRARMHCAAQMWIVLSNIIGSWVIINEDPSVRSACRNCM